MLRLHSGSRLPSVPCPNAQHAANWHIRPELLRLSVGQLQLEPTLTRLPPASDGLLPLAYALTHAAAATMPLSPPQGVRSLQDAPARQPATALVSAVACSSVRTSSSHCTVRAGRSHHLKHHGELGVRSKRARRAPGSIGTARLLVIVAHRTADLEVVSAVLAPDERLPARPGHRGQATCRGRRASSAPQRPRAPPEQCLRP